MKVSGNANGGWSRTKRRICCPSRGGRNPENRSCACAFVPRRNTTAKLAISLSITDLYGSISTLMPTAVGVGNQKRGTESNASDETNIIMWYVDGDTKEALIARIPRRKAKAGQRKSTALTSLIVSRRLRIAAAMVAILGVVWESFGTRVKAASQIWRLIRQA